MRRWAPLVFVVLFFLYFARGGLRAYFTDDDFMNIQHMHGYFTTPFSRVLLDAVNPFSASYRPLGGLFYRTLYAAAGFHPLPFRVVCFTLLALNLLLAYRLMRQISASGEAALIGALVLSYHAEMYGLYLNTGTIYDILCFTFVILSLTFYVRFRLPEGGLETAGWIAFLVCDLMALQSKEMGWMLPGVLLLYELIRHRGSPLSARRFAPCLFAGVLTLAPVIPRLLGPSGLTSAPLYHPTFRISYYLQNCARYWGLLVYRPEGFPVAVMLAIWAAMALAAWALRSRAMWFGLLFWMVTVIPVAVIQGRDGFVLYLPMFGLALYAGDLASRLRAAVFAGQGSRGRALSQVCLFAIVAAGLAVAHTRMSGTGARATQLQQQTRDLVAQLRRMHPTLTAGARVLFVEEPFHEEWFLAFLFRLLYRDPEIQVERAESRPHAQAYGYVFRYDGKQLAELPPRLKACDPRPLEGGTADDSSEILCWSGDWFSERFPAAMEGTLTHAANAGSQVTLQFRGTVVEYDCTRAFNRGLAELTIDGAPRGVLDLYSAGVAWQSAFRFENLPPGEHTAVLTVLGKRNPASSDSIVDVDAFRAW